MKTKRGVEAQGKGVVGKWKTVTDKLLIKMRKRLFLFIFGVQIPLFYCSSA